MESIEAAGNGLVHNNIVFILVRPVFLGNIGGVARVMKNFGFRNLRLVEPPKGYKDSEARRMSVGAFDVLKESQVFADINEALKDINIAIGTTSAQQRAMAPVPLPSLSGDLIAASQRNRIAFLFGDERNGLLNAELQRCHHVITIPTDPEFPALNLSQALAVCAYELVRSPASSKSSIELGTAGAADDQFFEQLFAMLDEVGFTRSFNRENTMSELRSFYQRAHPTERELDLMRGALHRINALIKAR